jgi:hypothetical protein
MSTSRASANGGLGGVVAVLFLVALVIKFIWWILGVLVLAGVFFVVRAAARWYSKRSAEYARYWDGLAVRADEQHNWVLQGDDRGIYGIEGAKLMDLLYPALDVASRPIKPPSRGPSSRGP